MYNVIICLSYMEWNVHIHKYVLLSRFANSWLIWVMTGRVVITGYDNMFITRQCLFIILNWQEGGDRSPVYIIYLDFQKAFDKLPQRLLLKTKITWDGDDINWIENGMNDRRQMVLVILSQHTVKHIFWPSNAVPITFVMYRSFTPTGADGSLSLFCGEICLMVVWRAWC